MQRVPQGRALIDWTLSYQALLFIDATMEGVRERERERVAFKLDTAWDSYPGIER